MIRKKLIFTGCSFTAGTGWDKDNLLSEAKNSPYLWTNLCYQNIPSLKKLDLINFGRSGGSNVEIFRNAISSMSRWGSDIDTLFCQWTSMPRYNFNVGFELWDTSESLSSRARSHDVNLNRGDHYTRQYINDLLDRLKTMHHLHWEILQVVEFSHVITALAQRLNIPNVFFINGLCPWDENYFVQLDNVLPESYTPFTKKEILNIDSRDDKDILTLYQQAHQHYKEAGGIDPSKWINLYNSFLSLKIDRNFDLQHPVLESNQKYFQLINGSEMLH